MKKRVLIVDGHPVAREGLRVLINQQTDMEVVAEAESYGGALAAAEKLQPDVALVEISLQRGKGLELVRDLQKGKSSPPVLVLSGRDEGLYAARSFRAGAKGYIMKGQEPGQILRAVREVLSGKTYMSERLRRQLRQPVGQPRDEMVDPLTWLTGRELEVFQLLGQGKSAANIAQRLAISETTVRKHRLRAKEKLGFQHLSDLVRFAVNRTEQGNAGASNG